MVEQITHPDSKIRKPHRSLASRLNRACGVNMRHDNWNNPGDIVPFLPKHSGKFCLLLLGIQQLSYITELVAELDAARRSGRITSLMRRLTRLDLLVLDDWGLQDFSAQARRDLLEIVEMSDQRKSTLIASQIPTKLWYQAIGEPTIADAILDRIIHNAYHIALKGKSMRRKLVPPALAELGDIN